jgi:hypothetical protein
LQEEIDVDDETEVCMLANALCGGVFFGRPGVVANDRCRGRATGMRRETKGRPTPLAAEQ